MVIARKFILKTKYNGLPKLSDVEIVEEELRPINDGEFLAEAVFLSVDPYMRLYPPPVGNVLMGAQIAKITESKLRGYPVGKYVIAHYGWRTHTISKEINIPDQILPDYGDLPLSLGIGALGMPGNTAYFGFLEICKPQKGETVVVSGAGGAIGSLVGQIGKIMGCKVIGILGDDHKGKYVTEKFGFDHFINYKKSDVKEQLMKLAPNGIDCYFDNVGGSISAGVISSMNTFGRISVCGFISSYNVNASDIQKVLPLQDYFVPKQLHMEGIVIHKWDPRWNEGINQMWKWIKEGKLKYKETVIEGFENTLQAMIDMLEGKSLGKVIVKV